jgi:hypothetical protein
MGRLEKRPDILLVPGCFQPDRAKPNVNNSQLGGLARKKRDQHEFHRGVASTGAELKALVTDVSLSGEVSGIELAQTQSAGSRTSTSSWSQVHRPTFRKMLRFVEALPTQRTSGSSPSLGSPTN